MAGTGSIRHHLPQLINRAVSTGGSDSVAILVHLVNQQTVGVVVDTTCCTCAKIRLEYILIRGCFIDHEGIRSGSGQLVAICNSFHQGVVTPVQIFDNDLTAAHRSRSIAVRTTAGPGECTAQRVFITGFQSQNPVAALTMQCEGDAILGCIVQGIPLHNFHSAGLTAVDCLQTIIVAGGIGLCEGPVIRCSCDIREGTVCTFLNQLDLSPGLYTEEDTGVFEITNRSGLTQLVNVAAIYVEHTTCTNGNLAVIASLLCLIRNFAVRQVIQSKGDTCQFLLGLATVAGIILHQLKLDGFIGIGNGIGCIGAAHSAGHSNRCCVTQGFQRTIIIDLDRCGRHIIPGDLIVHRSGSFLDNVGLANLQFGRCCQTVDSDRAVFTGLDRIVICQYYRFSLAIFYLIDFESGTFQILVACSVGLLQDNLEVLIHSLDNGNDNFLTFLVIGSVFLFCGNGHIIRGKLAMFIHREDQLGTLGITGGNRIFHQLIGTGCQIGCQTVTGSVPGPLIHSSGESGSTGRSDLHRSLQGIALLILNTVELINRIRNGLIVFVYLIDLQTDGTVIDRTAVDPVTDAGIKISLGRTNGEDNASALFCLRQDIAFRRGLHQLVGAPIQIFDDDLAVIGLRCHNVGSIVGDLPIEDRTVFAFTCRQNQLILVAGKHFNETVKPGIGIFLTIEFEGNIIDHISGDRVLLHKLYIDRLTVVDSLQAVIVAIGSGLCQRPVFRRRCALNKVIAIFLQELDLAPGLHTEENALVRIITGGPGFAQFIDVTTVNIEHTASAKGDLTVRIGLLGLIRNLAVCQILQCKCYVCQLVLLGHPVAGIILHQFQLDGCILEGHSGATDRSIGRIGYTGQASIVGKGKLHKLLVLGPLVVHRSFHLYQTVGVASQELGSCCGTADPDIAVSTGSDNTTGNSNLITISGCSITGHIIQTVFSTGQLALAVGRELCHSNAERFILKGQSGLLCVVCGAGFCRCRITGGNRAQLIAGCVGKGQRMLIIQSKVDRALILLVAGRILLFCQLIDILFITGCDLQRLAPRAVPCRVLSRSGRTVCEAANDRCDLEGPTLSDGCVGSTLLHNGKLSGSIVDGQRCLVRVCAHLRIGCHGQDLLVIAGS